MTTMKWPIPTVIDTAVHVESDAEKSATSRTIDNETDVVLYTEEAGVLKKLVTDGDC